MSTRWYPLYQKGNPQLRVFLPNFWMKMINPTRKLPENMVQFITSVEMTHYDVKNYLEKIYKVETADVKVEIMPGKRKKARGKGYIIKEDDYKLATVTLPRDQKFEFPNLFPKDIKDDMKEINQARQRQQEFELRNFHRPGIPGWFS